MKLEKILTIIAVVLLGLCLLCGLVKMTVKNNKVKKSCDDFCSLSLFITVVLLGTSQLVTEENYADGAEPGCCEIPPSCPDDPKDCGKMGNCSSTKDCDDGNRKNIEKNKGKCPFYVCIDGCCKEPPLPPEPAPPGPPCDPCDGICDNPTIWTPFNGCDVSCGAKCGDKCCCERGVGRCGIA